MKTINWAVYCRTYQEESKDNLQKIRSKGVKLVNGGPDSCLR